MTHFGGSDVDCENPREYKIGEPVWIIVAKDYNPTGRWKGEVRQYISGRKYNNIEAVITDPRVEWMHRPAWIRPYLGESPSCYKVMPRNTYTDELMLKIDKLENDMDFLRNHYKTREDAFKEALAIFKK